MPVSLGAVGIRPKWVTFTGSTAKREPILCWPNTKKRGTKAAFFYEALETKRLRHFV